MFEITRKTFILQLYANAYVKDSLVVSRDLKHAAYVGRIGEKKQCIIIDGTEGELFEGIGMNSLHFSPDGKHYAYVAATGSQQLVVRDGSREEAYDLILDGTPIFSPDSQHLIYSAKRGSEWRVVCDGKEHTAYHSAADITLSPNNNRVTYSASIHGKSYIILNGEIFASGNVRVYHASARTVRGSPITQAGEKRILSSSMAMQALSMIIYYRGQSHLVQTVCMSHTEHKPTGCK